MKPDGAKITLIVFGSDNGGPVAADNAPLHGRKNTVYEGGTRSPGVVAWPGHVKAGSTITEMLHVVDFYPTFLTLAGVPIDVKHQKLPLDGRNILPTLTSGKPSPHQELLLNTAPSGGALRVGDWKIVVHKAKQELYNLREDPNEAADLAATQPQKLQEMNARYNAYARQAVLPRVLRLK
jgi:arylsulfatase A-like enzyme